ncbi:MAG: putative ATPase [bacterium]
MFLLNQFLRIGVIMINKIKFKNYKLFKHQQTLELKPITVLIGKNSSGKSAVLKLPTLIENSLSGDFEEPLLLTNHQIELGGEFRDLIYGRKYGQLEISLEDDSNQLEVIIGSDTPINDPAIFSWKLNDVDEDVLPKENFKGFWETSKKIENFSLNINYISSYREGLKRYFEKSNKAYEHVGIKGENVYSILIKDALTTPKELIKQVSKFYQKNFEGWNIRVNQDNAPPYQIELEKDHLRVNLKEVGLGMIHALPLVVQSLMPAKEETLIIVEEPELHLHPAAHGNLAQLFAESSKGKNKRYLIETHSQNFVLRLRRLIAEGSLDQEDVVIYYVDFDEETTASTLVRINIDELGKPRNEMGEIYWPKNIFSETLDETSAIRAAQIDQKTS